MRGDEFFRQMASVPPFSKLDPALAVFFHDYLQNEKVTAFNGRYVVNTHLPPYPSRAFDQMVAGFDRLGDATDRRLFSVTLAVTNRCGYRCWHCYNARRSQQDLPLSRLQELARELQDLGTVILTLSGGEPLQRQDLEAVAAAFDDRSCLVLNTTGAGLTAARARQLQASGLFAMGVSLDCLDPAEHDRRRGHAGAFTTALTALNLATEAGLYPYVVTVATRDFLEPDNFWRFVEFVGAHGAREVHLLEPSAVGNLAGQDDVMLKAADRDLLFRYQREIAGREDLPALSSFAYLEAAEAFGCGAGLTHLYLDGSGEVCPCNLVPLSFGNVMTTPLTEILARMGEWFRQPRVGCVGHALCRHVPDGRLPMSPEASAELCRRCLPTKHEVPRFFALHAQRHPEVGQTELRSVYDRVNQDYDEFWVKEAGAPVAALVDRLQLRGNERVFEAGCGTGVGTVLLAQRLSAGGQVVAVDLSAGMLERARQRVQKAGLTNVSFTVGDALAALADAGQFDLVFTSWVLGYIEPPAFYAVVSRALLPGGRLAFVVHRENSPRVPLQIFGELVARDPTVLCRRVAFDFPAGIEQVTTELAAVGLSVTYAAADQITFHYDSPREVLEHLLKSGAGTAYYEALDPARRPALEQEFMAQLAAQHQGPGPYPVVHDYLVCIAARAGDVAAVPTT